MRRCNHRPRRQRMRQATDCECRHELPTKRFTPWIAVFSGKHGSLTPRSHEWPQRQVTRVLRNTKTAPLAKTVLAQPGAHAATATIFTAQPPGSSGTRHRIGEGTGSGHGGTRKHAAPETIPSEPHPAQQESTEARLPGEEHVRSLRRPSRRKDRSAGSRKQPQRCQRPMPLLWPKVSKEGKDMFHAEHRPEVSPQSQAICGESAG